MSAPNSLEIQRSYRRVKFQRFLVLCLQSLPDSPRPLAQVAACEPSRILDPEARKPDTLFVGSFYRIHHRED